MHDISYDAVLLIPYSLNYLIDRIWDDLGLVKVYTKKRGAHPDLFDPICMRKGSTIEVLTSQKHQLLSILMRYSGCLRRDPSLVGNKFSLCASMVSFMCLPSFRLRRLNHSQGKIFSGAIIKYLTGSSSFFRSHRENLPNLLLMHRRLGSVTLCKMKM